MSVVTRRALGNENPRSMTPLTTPYIVVTPATPERQDDDSQGAEGLLFDQDPQTDPDVTSKRFERHLSLDATPIP